MGIEPVFDVSGIGNAIMDILVEIGDDGLSKLGLKKGNFHLMSEKEAKALLNRLEGMKTALSPGGSGANTVYGVSALGGKAAFSGKVGIDEYGRIYESETAKSGVRATFSKHETIPTGYAITFITPDGERTFAVYPGAAATMEERDINIGDIGRSRIFHVEGYMLEDRRIRDVSIYAIEQAKRSGAKISVDLSDPGIVSRNREAIVSIVEQYADIVFANEQESMHFSMMEGEKAAEYIAGLAGIGVVKLGAKGSIIRSGKVTYRIMPFASAAMDTTGAGDMYAAGFLYGFSNGYGLDVCGTLGSYFASKVVGKMGARLEKVEKSELDSAISAAKPNRT
jgi:sugar/nucleoside kinase (ribokinase family)